MAKHFVQCKFCENRFSTRADIGEETQCPHKSGGCGKRFDITKKELLA